MKLIKPGDVKWWWGRVVTCDVCGAKFRLEFGDNVNRIYDAAHSLGEVVAVHVLCPCCGTDCRVTK